MSLIGGGFGLIGNAVGLLGGLSSARALQAAAEANYELEQENAMTRRDLSIAAIRTERTGQQAGYLARGNNFRLELLEIDQKKINIQRIKEATKYKARKDRENIYRTNDQIEQFQSQQLSTVGASGVLTEGSPMEVIADSYDEFNDTLSDLHDRMNYERAAGMQAAVSLEYETQIQAEMHHINRRMFKRERKTAAFANELRRVGVRSQFNTDMAQAEVNLMYAQAQVAGQQASSVAGAIGGLGNSLAQLFPNFGSGSSFPGFIPQQSQQLSPGGFNYGY